MSFAKVRHRGLMMKQVLIFHTGDTTCSEKPSYPGSMCPFVYARNFGTQPVCHLYDDAPLYDVDGWLQRRPECMANHRGAHDMSKRVKSPACAAFRAGPVE